jgi:hypothetical protein
LVHRDDRQEKELLFSRRIFAISEYELSNNALKFFDVKGLHKKHWVQIKEIPIYEITNIESYWNELSVTWNGITNLFFRKDSFESFSDLRERILFLQEERRKTLESEEKTNLRKTDLKIVISASMNIVDLLFDILMGLHEKRVDWKRLDSYNNSLTENLKFSLQSLEPFLLDFQKMSSAISKQIPKEVSVEAYSLLKLTYRYFDGLKLEDDLKEAHPNFRDAKSIIIAYYTLNDLLLGKAVREKDNRKEKHQLDSVLQILAYNTNFEVDIEHLKDIIDREIPQSDLEIVVEDVRSIFKEQLSQF